MTTLAADGSDLAASLRALADPTRLRLLRLVARQELCVCELYGALGLSQNLVSHHLRVLREAGLVSVRRDARWAHYSLRAERLDDLLGVTAAWVAEGAGVAAPACAVDER